MRLVRFYLPLQDNDGKPFPPGMFRDIEAELSARFGGVTAHLEAPASGRWRDGGETHSDEVVIFEVLSPAVDLGWWQSYRQRLERDFRQKRVLIVLQQVDVV